ncbi:MAG: hypothetical protein LBU44_05595 [Mediterranea sp.]|jgi:hypothetical protein|nr:hypothetical protein [Mediterranea sp.]
MKRFKFINVCLWVVLILTSCEKTDIDYNAVPVSDMALFQIGHYTPITKVATNNIYKIELNGNLLTNDKNVLAYYNTSPGGGVGRYFMTQPGTVNLKLYKGAGLELIYDQNVTLTKGKQNVIVHDYNQVPLVLERNFDIPYPQDPSKASFDTDTLGYIRFVNLLYETDNQPTTLKLQYQYQYTLHPLYTIADEKAGKIPAGKKVGDTTGDTTKSPWLNLGSPVGFGESTGFQPVPAIKTTYVSQGGGTSGGPRVDYRILVSAENGGVAGTNVVVNAAGDWVLKVGSTAFSDYWTNAVGRYFTHYFAGFRSKTTAAALYQFTEH